MGILKPKNEDYAKYKKVKPHDRTCKKCGNIFLELLREDSIKFFGAF